MIIKTVAHALLGRRLWLKVKRKYNVEKSGAYVIMMPDADREFNQAALRNIDRYLDYHKGNMAVILTTDEWTAKSAISFSERIAAAEQITEHDRYYLHHYYQYHDYFFSERFIVASLEDSRGKRLALVENLNGITKEDIACLGLFVIRDWETSGPAHG